MLRATGAVDTRLERGCTAALLVVATVVVMALLSADVAFDRSWSENRQILVRNGARLATDDGFYYLEIARNVALGAGSTFDGVHPTNGYHPLWLLTLIPVFWLTTSPEPAFLLGVALQACLFVLSCFVLTRTLRLISGWPVALPAALVWMRIQASHWVVFFGLEYALQALLVCLAGHYYLRDFGGRPPAADRPYLRLGIVLALCFLARLETGILATLLGAAILFGLPAGARRARAFLLLTVPLLVTASAYALLNGWMFGHPLPVSGAAKAARSELLLQADMIAASQGYAATKLDNLTRLLGTFNASFRLPLLFGLTAPLALLAGAGLTSRFTEPFRGTLRHLMPFVAYAWIHLGLVTLVFHGSESFKPWYFVVPLWLAVVVGAMVAEAIARAPIAAIERLRPVVVLVLVVGLLASITTNLARWRDAQRRPPTHAALLREVEWIGDNVPPGVVVGSWNAGIVAYFSDRRIVNLDGLVNSWRYFRQERFDLCDYWRTTGIRYLVDMFPTGRELEYLQETYAPWSDIGPCRADLTVVWRGAAAGAWSPTAIRVDGASPR